jgi:hypothetical protein
MRGFNYYRDGERLDYKRRRRFQQSAVVLGRSGKNLYFEGLFAGHILNPIMRRRVSGG